MKYLGHHTRNVPRQPHSGRYRLKMSGLLLWLVISMPVPADETALEEVIVTAQKREQNIQDISVSITAFGTEMIRDLGVGRPRDLAKYTPGLIMNASNNGESDPVFTLRGIGMNDVKANQNPAVTLYIDDVALPSISMLGFQIFDLERIEVLKGPQGTLYGRNTTGGAIRFLSKKPSEEFNAFARLDYGDFERTEFEGAAGGRLSDSVLARLAIGATLQKEGWQTLDTQGFNELGPGVDENNGEVDRKGIRGSILWRPAENLDVLVVGDYATDDSEVLGFQHAGNVLNDGSNQFCSFSTIGVRDETECATYGQIRETWTSPPVTPELEIYSAAGDNPWTIGSNFGQGNDIDGESRGVSATIDWGLERMGLTSVSGYRKFDRTMFTDGGATPFFQHDLVEVDDIKSLTQELRLASDESWGAVQWLFGLYYSFDEIQHITIADYRDHPTFVGLVNATTIDQETRNIGVFSQVEWSLTDQWRLVGGLRYTDEEREFQYMGDVIAGSAPDPVPFLEDKITASEWSGKLGVDYTHSDELLLYASASRGFKAGGFPSAIGFTPDAFLPYEAETLYAYEAGFKSTLSDGRVRFNSAVYYYDWRDFQAATAVDRGGIRLRILSNAGDVEILGLESELQWFPTEELTLRLGFNWMDADIVTGEYEGQRPVHTPEFTLSGIGRYDATASIGSFKPFVQVDFSYQDKQQFILPNHPAAVEDAYTTWNARAGLRSEEGHWELSAYARNLTDDLYRTEVFGPGSRFLPGRIFYGAPRTWGVSVSYFF